MKYYYEHENVIYRAEIPKGWKIPVINAFICNGKWCQPSPRQVTDARTWGTPMTEAEAKDFQGDGWPAEEAPPA